MIKMTKIFKNLFIIIFCGVFLCGCNSDKRTLVKFSTWGSKSETAILAPILAEFEKENPDIKVELVHIPQNYFQKMHLLFASNLAPDVIFINNLYLPIYANAGLLEPLKIDEEPFFKQPLQALSYNGKLYAVPRDVSNLVIYYNKDIFDRFNVSYPLRDWRFDRFLKKASFLTRDTNADGKTDIWAIGFEEDMYYWLPFLMSEGGGAVSDDLKSIIISEPKSKKGLQFYTDLRNKYHYAPTSAQSASATMAQLFLQGKLAMHVSGRWMTPKYTKEAKFRWDVINFPSGDAGSVVPLDASGWAMSSDSRHKPEAMRLIEFLASKSSIEQFCQGGLIVPARKDVANSKMFSNTSDKSNYVFINAIRTSKKTPVPLNYKEITDRINERADYLFNSDKSVDEVFKDFK